MKRILLLIETIYCNIFRCNYLWNEKLLLKFFFFAISKFKFKFENLKKKITVIADVFLNLQTRKNVVR